MPEKPRKLGPFWWLVILFVAINVLWLGPSFFRPRGPGRGQEAPAFSLPLVPDPGARLALEDLRGHTVLLLFWATWCDACMGELPVVAQMLRRYSGQGLVVVGMNLEPENRQVVGRFLATRSITYPNVTVDASTAEAYGVSLLPAITLVDRDGLVCRGFRGRTGELRLSRAVRRCIEKGSG